MALVEAALEILEKPTTIVSEVAEIIVYFGPVWVAFLLGLMVGWAWKPRWATFSNSKFDTSAPPSPSGLIASHVEDSTCIKNSTRPQGFASCDSGVTLDREKVSPPLIENSDCRSLELKKEENPIVNDEDLAHICHLVERTDGGPSWKHMMDRSTPSMSYQAWQRDVENGPPQFCSRTVYEDATPELLRDFFWDDEFRLKWDDMLIHAATIEECPTTGTMIVHWIRKFPFFCSDREYTIGRRIWESGRSYYCVTKGVDCPSIPRKDKPRRVDVFYSSWLIRAAESRKGNGQLNACEVLLFHYEDMGIPYKIAKFGIRQGMWGTVENIERGVRAYQKARASEAPFSRSAFMAQVNTKIDPDYLQHLEGNETLKETESQVLTEKPKGLDIPKLLILGGAILVACSLDRGLLTKGLLLNVGRRFANIGRKAHPPRT